MFNPMTDVPQTDEEVKIALTHGRDDLTGRNLVGIYQCRRGQGDSLLAAYEAALIAYLKAAGYDVAKQASTESPL